MDAFPSKKQDSPRRLGSVARVAVCGLLAVAAAALPRAGLAQDERDTVFPTAHDPDFGDAGPALAEFLRRQRGAPRGAHQHFCIVGYQRDSGYRRALVLWREGGKLVVWNAVSDPAARNASIADSRRVLDLTKDVVARDADIAASSWLVTRAWVARVEQDCAEHGTAYTVARTASKGR